MESNLPTYALEFFHKGRNALKNPLFLFEILRIKGAHLGQNFVQLRAVLTGKFPLERGRYIKYPLVLMASSLMSARISLLSSISA